MAKTVTVIGAGIVGVCCALHLQREGFKVRLVEKGEPGSEASFGNSGSFGTASCVPFAMPGVLKKVPKMLFDSESPLKLRWSHVPEALPWFLRFIAASRPSRVEEIAAARNSLLVHTHAGYAPLIEGAEAQQWVNDDGLMMTFESEAAFEGAAYALDLRRRHGVHMDILDGNEARQMEPALSTKVIKAVSLPDVNRTIDPLRLCDSLAQDFVRRGGEIVNAEVQRLRDRQRGPDQDRHRPRPDRRRAGGARGRRVVAAARQAARHLGAARGRARLSRDVRQPGFRPEARAGLGRPQRLAGPHARRHPRHRRRRVRRARRAGRHAHRRHGRCATPRQLVPGLKGEPASKWMGPRPSHPDSKPVIGRSPRHKNVFFAFGHDHLGLTMAGITGKLVAELATGKPTTVDLAPFRPDRF